MKKVIKLTESDLHKIVKNSVKKIIKEWDDGSDGRINDQILPIGETGTEMMFYDEVFWKLKDIKDYWGNSPKVSKNIEKCLNLLRNCERQITKVLSEYQYTIDYSDNSEETKEKINNLLKTYKEVFPKRYSVLNYDTVDY